MGVRWRSPLGGMCMSLTQKRPAVSSTETVMVQVPPTTPMWGKV